MKSRREVTDEWEARLQSLVGRRIKSVSYMSDSEIQAIGWNKSPIVIELEDGVLLFPSRDDEGNGAGSLFVDAGKTAGLPSVIPSI